MRQLAFGPRRPFVKTPEKNGINGGLVPQRLAGKHFRTGRIGKTMCIKIERLMRIDLLVFEQIEICRLATAAKTLLVKKHCFDRSGTAG